MSLASPATDNRLRSAVAAAVLLALIVAVPAVGSASPKDELEAAESRLAEIENGLAAQHDALAGIQTELTRAATALGEAEFKLEDTQERIDLVQEEIDAAVAEYERIKAQLEERARIGFMEGGSSSELGVLLESNSMAELSDRIEFLDAVAGDDSDLAVRVDNERVLLEEDRGELEDLRDDQERLVEERRRQRDSLQQQLDAAEAARARLADLQAEAEDILADKRQRYQEWQEHQQQLAAQAAAAAASSGGGSVSTGSSPFDACPVPSGAVSNSFGAPRVGHLHMGVDIFASMGAPIVAPFSGTASTSSNSIGGLAVNVSSNEGKGYVYNAHLSKVGQLGAVSAGDVIGYVGTTGNAAGTSPHDHFEWHPASIPSNVPTSPYGQSVLSGAVNPYPYLTAVC
jgi:murein DD-endopeptidase MepM/ murein hydrolase activator NlpD